MSEKRPSLRDRLFKAERMHRAEWTIDPVKRQARRDQWDATYQPCPHGYPEDETCPVC
jgi:hypothetical protein